MGAGIPVVHRARFQESIYRIPRLPHSRAQRSTSGGASRCQMVRAVQSAPGGIRKFHWESVIPPRRREFGLGVEKSPARRDRKSTRLNSSHPSISYAVFCLKKKKTSVFPPRTRK